MGKDIEERRKELKRELEELDLKEKENLVSKGKAYHCKECDKIVEKSEFGVDEYISLGICYSCNEQRKIQSEKERIMKMIEGGVIYDIIPSYYDWEMKSDEINGVILKVGDKYYTLGVTTDYDGGSRIEVIEGKDTDV